MYGIELNFWQELFLLLTIVLLLLVSFNALMRKLLKVEKKNFFSYDHVNEEHSKIDWTIRIIFIVILLLRYFVDTTGDPMDSIWFLEPWYIMMVFIVVTEVARATKEYKYAENRNAYKLTISQLVFIVVIFLTLYWSNFLGME